MQETHKTSSYWYSTTLFGKTYILFLFVSVSTAEHHTPDDSHLSTRSLSVEKKREGIPSFTTRQCLSSVFLRHRDNVMAKMHGPYPLLLCCNPSKVKWIEFSLSFRFYWSVVLSAESIGCQGISVCDLLTYWPLWGRRNWIKHLTTCF